MTPCATSSMFLGWGCWSCLNTSIIYQSKVSTSSAVGSRGRQCLFKLARIHGFLVENHCRSWTLFSRGRPLYSRHKFLIVGLVSDPVWYGLPPLLTLWETVPSLRKGRHEAPGLVIMAFYEMDICFISKGSFSYSSHFVEGAWTWRTWRNQGAPRLEILCSYMDGNSWHCPVKCWQDPVVAAWSGLQ